MPVLTSVLLSVALATPPAAPPAIPPGGPPPNRASPRPSSVPSATPDDARRGIPGLLAADALPVQVASGFRFTEGPAADREGRLYFTDVAASRILRLVGTGVDRHGSVEDVIVNSDGCNGLMFAADGTLYACQGGAGRIAIVDLEKRELRPVATSVRIGDAAVPLGRVNDLAIDRGGGIYFTDPSLGRKEESPTRGIHYRARDGTVTRVDTVITGPNGALLSPDGSRLYALSYKDPGVWCFEVTAPGTLGEPKRIAQLTTFDGTPRGRGDGLAADAKGNLWCTNPDLREIQVFSPEGALLGRVSFPEPPSNCAFGGPDGKTLYVTAVTSVYALPTLVEGYWVGRAGAEGKRRAE